MTFSGSTRFGELARQLPLESIVLETDAPDIPPAWLNGGRNTPAELPRIAAVLAEFANCRSPSWRSARQPMRAPYFPAFDVDQSAVRFVGPNAHPLICAKRIIC